MDSNLDSYVTRSIPKDTALFRLPLRTQILFTVLLPLFCHVFALSTLNFELYSLVLCMYISSTWTVGVEDIFVFLLQQIDSPCMRPAHMHA